MSRIDDLLPPQSLESEAALLGACIIDSAVIDDVSLIVGPESFYADAHATIYRAIISVHEKSCGSDIVALVEALRSAGKLDAIGGADALVRLAEQTPSAIAAVRYANTVRDKHRLRVLIDVARQIDYEARNAGDNPADDVLARCEEMVFQACSDPRVGTASTMAQVLADEAKRLEAIHDGSEKYARPSSPWPVFDSNLSGGAAPGEMIVVAARPSMGKTAMGIDWCMHMARTGTPCLFVSLEMSARAVGQRVLSMLGGIELPSVIRGTLGEWGLDRVAEVRASPEHESVYVYDRSGATLPHIRAVARRLKRKAGIGAVFIDYIQLLAGGVHNKSRYEEVTLLSRNLKLMAKSLDVPVVCLAQLNRNAPNRGDNMPKLSDLRDSGAIEQDADVVVLLHREGYYHVGEQEWNGNANAAEFIIAKNRNGPTGIIDVSWAPKIARFVAQ